MPLGKRRFSEWPDTLLRAYYEGYGAGKRLVGANVYIDIWRLAENANILSSEEIEYKRKVYGGQPDDDLRETVRIMEETGLIRTKWLDEERWHWERTPEGLEYMKLLMRPWHRKTFDAVKSHTRAIVIGIIIVVAASLILAMITGAWRPW